MNIAFTALTLISLVLLTITAPATAFPTMIEGVRDAILLILKLTAIYAVWLSVLKMMQTTGLDQKLSRGLRPLIKRLFKGETDEAYKWISINLASNMLGMGGAATPAGIKAMNAMCLQEGKATDNMLLLLVINATSIQLIPAAVIALRATAGSANAASIFAPTLIATFFSTFIGTVLCKLFSKRSEKDGSASTKTPNLSNTAVLLPDNKGFKSLFGKNKQKSKPIPAGANTPKTTAKSSLPENGTIQKNESKNKRPNNHKLKKSAEASSATSRSGVKNARLQSK